jgi:hypothetical protein
MKANTKKLLNDQIKLILKELEMIDDIKDRVELRIEAVEVIYKVSCHDLEEIMPQGKESLKEDKAKEPREVTIDEIDDEEDENAEEVVVEGAKFELQDPIEIPEEMVYEVEPEPQEVSIDNIVTVGENLQPEQAAEVADKLQVEVVDNLDEEDEPVIVNEIDVTEAFKLLNPEISRDFREEYALQIMEYETLETYKTLNFIKETDDSIIGAKNLVAYWIDSLGLDTVEYYINYFGSNIELNDEGEELYIDEELHIDFLNENNIQGFVDYVNSLSEE